MGRTAYKPGKKKETTSIRLSPILIRIMEEEKVNRSQLIEKLLRIHYGII